jgi:VWFA-related protein
MSAQKQDLSIQITSPLGRTGTPGAVRIVARVEGLDPSIVAPVHFLVDGSPFKVDDDGPPYAVEWVDENPFDRREISVALTDPEGRTASDQIVLEPFVLTDKTDVFSVVLEVMVRDAKGRFVPGLTPGHFLLEEDGKWQKPDLISQEAVPASFALLVDSSQSMSRRFGFVREAAGRLVSYLRPLDRVMVVPFNKTLSAVTGPTDDRVTIDEAIAAIRARGGTAIFDCLKAVAERISPMEGRRNIILITDGYDENSEIGFDEAVAAVSRANATVYVVAIGGAAGISLQGEDLLRRLALATGGRAYFPAQTRDLRVVYDQLALDAQNRYILSYTPINQRQTGEWRAVSVTSSQGLVLTTRAGYHAPMAPPIRPTIEFTVMDAGLGYVDVTREDLIVREDGVEQQVDAFAEAVDPIQMVLTLDQSGSMKKSAEAVKAAASEFVRALRPDDPLAVITFSDKPTFAHDLATTREWSLDAIERYQTVGGTALYDALHDSIMRLKYVKGRRAVVVVTDGRDENNAGTAAGSKRTLDEVIKLAKDVEANIFAIGLGPNVDRAVLEQLADISAGRAYFPADASELPADYRNILQNLRRRYVIGYASSNRERDGAWRRVEIVVRSTGLQAKSRGGYFAPER